jgi:hypothetical protein
LLVDFRAQRLVVQVLNYPVFQTTIAREFHAHPDRAAHCFDSDCLEI